MRELFPKAQALGVLVNPQNPRAAADVASVRTAAGTFGIETYPANASAKSDFEAAFVAFQSKHVDALIILGDPLASRERKDASGRSRHVLRSRIPAGGWSHKLRSKLA